MISIFFIEGEKCSKVGKNLPSEESLTKVEKKKIQLKFSGKLCEEKEGGWG